jgi:hypothetical protein
MYERPARGHNPTTVRLISKVVRQVAQLLLQSGGFEAAYRSLTCTLAGIHKEDTQLVVQMIHQVVHKPQEIHTFFVYRDGITPAPCANCLHFDTD